MDIRKESLELTKIARNVGCLIHEFDGELSYEFRSDEQLKHFIDIVTKEEVYKEREACADLCRELYLNDGITCAEYIMERE